MEKRALMVAPFPTGLYFAIIYYPIPRLYSQDIFKSKARQTIPRYGRHRCTCNASEYSRSRQNCAVTGTIEQHLSRYHE